MKHFLIAELQRGVKQTAYLYSWCKFMRRPLNRLIFSLWFLKAVGGKEPREKRVGRSPSSLSRLFQQSTVKARQRAKDRNYDK